MRSPDEIQTRIAWLEGGRAVMLAYLDLKQDNSDWHGVQDAGSDLRDIEAELLGLRWVLGD